jgi:uncharacterized DUF497 family protein
MGRSPKSAKNRINICKHDIDFNDAIDIFNHPVLTALDKREDYGEDRWLVLGWVKARGVVVYVERGADVIRVISTRKAKKHEARHYEQKTREDARFGD